MSTKHTPGPWTIAEAYGNTIVENQDVAVCKLTGTPEEIEANARLIAASPDLLAACKALARIRVETCPRCGGSGGRERQGGELAEACGNCGGTGKETGNPDPHDIEHAKAALAKAEGEL